MTASKKLFFTITGIFIVFFFSSCVELSRSRETTRPLPEGIPDREIVFAPDKYKHNGTRTLGFVNADGTGRVTYTFSFAGGARSMFGMVLFTEYASLPRWSPSGEELIFTIRNTAPNMRLIDNNGNLYGRKCDEIAASISFDAHGNILKVLHKHDRVFEEYRSLANDNEIILIHYDLKNCEILSTDILPTPKSIAFGIGEEAENGVITITYYEPNNEAKQFFIYRPQKGDYQIFPGFNPHVNNTGTILAYQSTVETIVIYNLETNSEYRLNNKRPVSYSITSWSPDSKWLLYNTSEGEIYKINIETGENIYITDGWNPDWR